MGSKWKIGAARRIRGGARLGSVDDVQTRPAAAQSAIEASRERQGIGERSLLHEDLAVGDAEVGRLEAIGQCVALRRLARQDDNLHRTTREQECRQRGQRAHQRFAGGEQDEDRRHQEQLFARQAAPVESLDPRLVALRHERLGRLETDDAHGSRQFDHLARRFVEGGRGHWAEIAGIGRYPRRGAEIVDPLAVGDDPQGLGCGVETPQAIARRLEPLPPRGRRGSGRRRGSPRR